MVLKMVILLICTRAREQAAPQVTIEPFDGNPLSFACFLSMFFLRLFFLFFSNLHAKKIKPRYTIYKVSTYINTQNIHQVYTNRPFPPPITSWQYVFWFQSLYALLWQMTHNFPFFPKLSRLFKIVQTYLFLDIVDFHYFLFQHFKTQFLMFPWIK